MLFLLIGFGIAFICWLMLSLKTVKRNERGVIIQLGRPLRMVESGLRLVKFPLERLLRVTTAELMVNYEGIEFITIPGYYIWETQTRDGRVKTEREKVASTRAWLDVGIYWSWSGNENILLEQTIPRLPTFDLAQFKEWMAEVIIGGVKTIGGRSTWRHLTQETKEAEGEITRELTEGDSPLLTSLGLQGLRVEISRVTLPEQLMEALNRPEIARHHRNARIIQAEGEERAGNARVRVEANDIRALQGISLPAAIVKASQRWSSDRRAERDEER